MKPEMVASIPDVIPPPKQGPLEAIDEVKKKYNFSQKINLIRSHPPLITIMEI